MLNKFSSNLLSLTLESRVPVCQPAPVTLVSLQVPAGKPWRKVILGVGEAPRSDLWDLVCFHERTKKKVKKVTGKKRVDVYVLCASVGVNVTPGRVSAFWPAEDLRPSDQFKI